MSRNYTGEKTQVSYGEEWTEYTALTGGTVANYQVTGLSGLTADRYNGQLAFVMYRGGSVDGEVYHVVVNTTTAITFEENVQTAGLANTDVIAITTHGKLPTATTEYFGDVIEADLPDPKVTEKSYYARGNTNEPERKDASLTKKEYDATIPIELINGKLLFYGLGYCKDVASNYGAGSTTAARGVMIGETIIQVASATNFSVDDYIEIGDNSGGSLNEGSEIRQVTAINTVYFTLDNPVRRYHPSGCAVKECDIASAKPVTHTLKPWSYIPTITLEAVFKGHDKNQTTNDLVLHYTGTAVGGLSLKSSEENITCDLAIKCLNALKNQRTRATLVTTDWTSNKYLYADSEVTINSVQYRQVENMDYGTDRGLKPKYYHNQDTGIKPFEHAPEGFEHKWTLGIPLHNTDFWDLVEDGTQFDASVTYERDATDDYITFNFDDNYGRGAPTKLADRAEIIQDIDISVGLFYIDVVDTIEYY